MSIGEWLEWILSAEIQENVRKLMIVILWVTSAYIFIAVFAFTVPKSRSGKFGYQVIDLNKQSNNDQFITMLIQSVSDFQNRLCGKSFISLLMRLTLFYGGFLTITSSAIDPVAGRQRGANELVALAVWIVSNVFCDFISFQSTRLIYNFLAGGRPPPKERQNDTIWSAIVKIAFCSLFHNRFPGMIVRALMDRAIAAKAPIKTKLEALVAPARKARAHLIVVDVVISIIFFSINGYMTNYCYLLLIGENSKGLGYSFFTPIEIGGDLTGSVLSNIFYNCIIQFDSMLRAYPEIISSDFDLLGHHIPGMAGITFITMATSLGPASMYFVHALRKIEPGKWIYPVYLTYLVAFSPLVIIGSMIASASSIKSMAGQAFSWIVALYFVSKLFPWIMKTINRRYLAAGGCMSPI
jgi:hypothetical protein